jgi:CTD small phosphatase-like protein 2
MQALQEQTEEDQDDFNPWQFIASLPNYRMVSHLTPPVSLPPKDPSHPPLTLVLDLDETLVHCTVEACQGADFEFPVVFHGVSYQVHVRQRPYLKEFLQKIKNKYEVVIFTASQKVYADTLLNQLDPGTLRYVTLLRIYS